MLEGSTTMVKKISHQNFSIEMDFKSSGSDLSLSYFAHFEIGRLGNIMAPTVET